MTRYIPIILAAFLLAGCASGVTTIENPATGISMDTYRDIAGPFDNAGIGFVFRRGGEVIGTHAQGMPAPATDLLKSAIGAAGLVGAAGALDLKAVIGVAR